MRVFTHCSFSDFKISAPNNNLVLLASLKSLEPCKEPVGGEARKLPFLHDKVVGGVQKGSCACMCNWTGVGSSLTTAGQVKYLFLSVQRLEAL